MESIDTKIMALLANDGRMSYTDIGRATGLSTSAAQQRVRRLEQRGAITGYHAHLNPTELGHTLKVFISIGTFDAKKDDEVLTVLTGMREITSCYSVAGNASYLCVAELGDTSDLDDLLSRLRHNVGATTVTTVVLRTYFLARPVLWDDDEFDTGELEPEAEHRQSA